MRTRMGSCEGEGGWSGVRSGLNWVARCSRLRAVFTPVWTGGD